MNAKEKAQELFEKFKEYSYTAWNGGENEMTTEQSAKECSLIAVNELINMARIYDNHNVKTDKHIYTFECVVYWQEVKSEIERLVV